MPEPNPYPNNPINLSFRRFFGNPIHNFCCPWIKNEKGERMDALWILPNTPYWRKRYDDTFLEDPPPTIETEALQRAGGIYYSHWWKCELVRAGLAPTLTTELVFSKDPLTAEQLQRAREELETNPQNYPEGQIEEEWKTLAWLEEEFRDQERLDRVGKKEVEAEGEDPEGDREGERKEK
ncbi:hypothetical protein B0J14DRAFT_182466 [Halenospora varia]|nr:hypothetical protein B0J14DRAFT_182466 [Halenospora varia]